MCKVRAVPGSLKCLPSADQVGGGLTSTGPSGPLAGATETQGATGNRGCSRGMGMAVVISLGPQPHVSPENFREQLAALCSQGLHPELPKNQDCHTTHQTCSWGAEQAFSAAETSGGGNPRPRSTPLPQLTGTKSLVISHPPGSTWPTEQTGRLRLGGAAGLDGGLLASTPLLNTSSSPSSGGEGPQFTPITSPSMLHLGTEGDFS